MRNGAWCPIQTFAVLLLSLGVLTCTEESNPYDVPDAAEIVWGDEVPADGASIPFFTTTTINGKILLSEHVNRLTVVTPGNMAEPSDTLEFDGATRGWPTFSFRASFADTGAKMITATGLLSNGDSIRADRLVYVHSPLNPRDIDAGIGSLVELRTDPVGDDVTYVWDLYFTNEILSKKSGTNVVKYTIRSPAPDSGVLYVQEHERRSIGASFLITARDLTPPEITLIEAELSPTKDTVFLSRDRKTIRFEVTDNKELSVADVQVNGVDVPCSSGVCSYTLNFETTVVKDRNITITAADFAGNTSEMALVVRYDPSQGAEPYIDLGTKLDEQSRYTTTNDTVNLYGEIQNASGTWGLRVTRNAVVDTVLSVTSGTPFDFYRPVLSDTVEFLLALYPDTTARGNPITTKRFIAIKSAVDETPPDIEGFYVGTTLIGNTYTTSDSVITLRVQVKDQNSGVKTVYIQSKKVQDEGDGFYSAQVPLSHIPNGNTIHVIAENTYDSTTTESRTIYYNNPPEVTFRPADIAYVGRIVVDTFDIIDPDGDALTVTAERRFSDLVEQIEISPGLDRLVRWTPSTTGDYEYSITVEDNYDDGKPEVFRSGGRVYAAPADTNDPVDSTKFAIAYDFPDTLTAGLDSLFFIARTTPPFQSTKNSLVALLRTSAGQAIDTLDITDDTLVNWKPLSTDTGEHELYLKVITAGSGVTDSLVRGLTVIPRATVAFSGSLGEVAESDNTYNIGITMNRPVAVPVTVSVTTGGGNANRGADYTIADTSGTFASGQTQLNIPITIIDDQTRENEEEYIVFQLLGPSSQVDYSSSQYTLYIKDNDTGSTAIEQPKVFFTGNPQRVRETETTIHVGIALSKAPHEPVEVGIGTGGTAVLSEDYSLSSNSVRFEIGDSLEEVRVAVLVDGVCEKSSEYISLVLENPSGAEFGSVTEFRIEIDPNEQSLCSKNAVVVSGNCGGRYKKECENTDIRLIDTLEAHGYVVTQVFEGEFMGAGDPALTNSGVVFVSQSVRQQKIVEQLKGVAKPVVCATGLNDYSVLGLAQNATGSSEKEFLTIQPNNVIRNDLSAAREARILSGIQPVPWAIPAASATIVATLQGEPDHAAIFLYDPGVTLADGTKAASARAGFPMIEFEKSVPEYEAEWWNLLIEVLDWAASENE